MGARGRVGYWVPLFRIDSWRLVCLYCREPWTFRTDYFNCDGNLGFLGPPVFLQWRKTCFGIDYWDPLFLHGLLAPLFAQTIGTLHFGMDCWHLFMCIGGDPGFCVRPAGVLDFDLIIGAIHCCIGGHSGLSH